MRLTHILTVLKMNVDSVFDADRKEEVEDNVNGYSSLSEEVADSLLDKEIEKGEIAKCLRNLKNSKTGGSDGIWRQISVKITPTASIMRPTAFIMRSIQFVMTLTASSL